MEKELIYHIGTFKTGSTSLQFFFDNNKEELLKEGIFYPECLLEEGRPELIIGNRGNAYPLNVPSIDSLEFRKGIDNLKELFSHYNKILISSEDFWSSDTKQERLREIKKIGVTVKVIVYLRRQDEYLDSLCNQLIKTGLLSFEKGQSHIYELGLYADYYSELSDIENVIGKNNIIVRIFEKEQLYKGNIFDDFLRCLDIERTEFIIDPDKISNRSLSNKHRDLINICNSTLGNSYRKVDQFIWLAVLELSERYLSQESKKEQSNFFTEQERRSIVEKYRKGNESIAKEYLQRENGILFYNISFQGNDVKEEKIEIEDIIRWVTLLIYKQNSRIEENRINYENEIRILEEKLEIEKQRNNRKQRFSGNLRKGRFGKRIWNYLKKQKTG